MHAASLVIAAVSPYLSIISLQLPQLTQLLSTHMYAAQEVCADLHVSACVVSHMQLVCSKFSKANLHGTLPILTVIVTASVSYVLQARGCRHVFRP